MEKDEKFCCNCDCSQEACDNEEIDTLVLTLDDGTELQCDILKIFNYNGKEYVAIAASDDEGDNDIMLYGFNEINDEEVELISIDDEKLFEEVEKEFEKIFSLED